MSPIVTSCSHWYRCSLPLIYTLHLEINQLSINNKSIAILLWNIFIWMLESLSYMSDKRLVRNMYRNVAVCSSSPMCPSRPQTTCSSCTKARNTWTHIPSSVQIQSKSRYTILGLVGIIQMPSIIIICFMLWLPNWLLLCHMKTTALEPCLEQPQIFQIFQKLGWRGEGEIP